MLVFRIHVPYLQTRETVDTSIVDPVLTLLASLELQVQYESCELMKEFVKFAEIKELTLTGLVKMLQSSEQVRVLSMNVCPNRKLYDDGARCYAY